MKLYSGHNEDNSTTGRESVGEVVGSLVKEIGGKVKTIAIACMDSLENNFDVCSIEANVYEENGIVSGVESITGIAVANSSNEQPAFEGARRLTPIQCFESVEEPPTLGDRKNMEITLKDLLSVPKDMFKQAVKERNFFPQQLFELEDMENDKVFGSVFKEKNELAKKAETLENEFNMFKESTAKEKKEFIKLNAKDTLMKTLPEGLTESQKAFITKGFDPDKIESLDEENLKSFVDSSLNEYNEYAKIFGGKTENKPANDNKLEDDSNLSDEEAFEKAFNSED